jgi:hypothetical protein
VCSDAWSVGFFLLLGLGPRASLPRLIGFTTGVCHEEEEAVANVLPEPKSDEPVEEYSHVHENTWFSMNCAMGVASVWLRFAGFAVKVK